MDNEYNSDDEDSVTSLVDKTKKMNGSEPIPRTEDLSDSEDEESESGSEDDLGSLNDLLDEVELSDSDEEKPKKKGKKGKKAEEAEEAEESFLEAADDEDEEEDEDSEDEDDDHYLKKFDEQIKKNVIADYHPELNQHNYEEIEALTTVIRNSQGMIIDPLHRTIPFLTKYEKARILGDRARQINSGAKPLVEVEAFIMDGYLIALKELDEKKIPFIIKRPLPNGGVEYWKLKDLEILV